MLRDIQQRMVAMGQPESTEENLSEQEQVRRDKLGALREAGFGYPNDVDVSSKSNEVVAATPEALKKEESERERFRLAGRIVAMRVMGKASFCHIQDRSGKLQLYVRRDDVGTESYSAFKKFSKVNVEMASWEHSLRKKLLVDTFA